jgi:hypothetical protein
MRVALLSLALAACGHPPPATTQSQGSAQVAASPIDVTMRMRAERKGQKFGVTTDDTLRTGDIIELFVLVNQPAYVYVVQFFPDGTSAVLFPETGDRLVQPGGELRIPETGSDLQLDEHTGAENIYVLASREPVAKADAVIAKQIDGIRTSGAGEPAGSGSAQPVADPEPAPKPDPTPPDAKQPEPVRIVTNKRPTQHASDRMLTLATRNIKRIKRPDGAPALTGTADKREDSLLVIRFSFKHE